MLFMVDLVGLCLVCVMMGWFLVDLCVTVGFVSVLRIGFVWLSSCVDGCWVVCRCVSFVGLVLITGFL